MFERRRNKAGARKEENPMTLIKPLFLAAVALASAAPLWAQDQAAKPSAAVLIEKVLQERGLEAAVKKFSEWRGQTDKYTFDEREFNALGYRLLGRQAYAKAIAVFQMNVEMHPSSVNVYDSLAEAYLRVGDKEKARANYQQVLEKDAENSNAKKMLRDIDSIFERLQNEHKHAYKPGEKTGLWGPYLGQEPPGIEPKMFAPGLVSLAASPEFGGTFSPDGKELYFTRNMVIMVSRELEGGWTVPEPAKFSRGFRAHEPHITADGKKLYFSWNHPSPEGLPKPPEDYGIWVSERTTEGWSEPQYVGYGMYVTSGNDGRIYVTDISSGGTEDHIARAVMKEGRFSRLELLGGALGRPPAGSTGTAHPCVSPDGRTMLFDANRKGGLYVSFSEGDGNWSEPIRLSEHGLPADANISWFSHDGKYLFFSDGVSDIFWVSAALLEGLRPKK